jgi:DNA gyrase inhibitor GyrI
MLSRTKGESSMTDLDVRIVRLAPMRVAASLGFGPEPEARAWQALMDWARANDLPADPAATRFFGFNNPSPSAGSPNYGYEQWMTVGPNPRGGANVKIKDVPGGVYAVLHCEDLSVIGERWQQLVTWVDNSAYHMSPMQCLEECLNPLEAGPARSRFELYLPIIES